MTAASLTVFLFPSHPSIFFFSLFFLSSQFLRFQLFLAFHCHVTNLFVFFSFSSSANDETDSHTHAHTHTEEERTQTKRWMSVLLLLLLFQFQFYRKGAVTFSCQSVTEFYITIDHSLHPPNSQCVFSSKPPLCPTVRAKSNRNSRFLIVRLRLRLRLRIYWPIVSFRCDCVASDWRNRKTFLLLKF